MSRDERWDERHRKRVSANSAARAMRHPAVRPRSSKKTPSSLERADKVTPLAPAFGGNQRLPSFGNRSSPRSRKPSASESRAPSARSRVGTAASRAEDALNSYSQQAASRTGSRTEMDSRLGGATSRVETGFFTMVSKGKGHSMNQDSMLALRKERVHVVGVYDGHGDVGHHASSFAKDHISEHLLSDSRLESDPEKAMKEAYRKTCVALGKSGIDTRVSGSTAVTVLRHKGQLVIGNVGDSRAVLGRQDKGGQAQAIDLTKDQTPKRADERQRVSKAKGVMHPSVGMLPGGGLGYMGDPRVWDPSGMYGLAMTRSIGDTMVKKSGVIAVPEVSTKKIDSRDKMIIVGSDGIWDFVSSQEAVDVAFQHKDSPKRAAQVLTKLARSRWDEASRGTVADDISAVVMKIAD